MRPCVIPAPPCRHSRTHPPSFPRKRESRVGSQAGGACFTYTTSLSAGSYAKVSEGGNPGAGAAGSPARPLMVSRSFLLTLKTVAAEGCAPINRRPQHTLPPQSRRAATPPVPSSPCPYRNVCLSIPSADSPRHGGPHAPRENKHLFVYSFQARPDRFVS